MNIIRMISKFNFYTGTTSRIKYIVIHYVGATSTAKENCEYYASGVKTASAHYFIDHNGDVYQSVEDANSAWHCGLKSGNYKHSECRNTNSIGIELCCRTTGNPKVADENWYFEDATVTSAIELTKELMAKYNIPADHVIRHYDVTGKTCPAPYVFNKGKHTWDQFKAAISTAAVSIQNQTKILKTSSYSDQDMWNDLKNNGFPEVAVAAWFGNIKAESGLDSKNLQNSYNKSLGMTDDQYVNAVDNGSYTKMQFVNDKAGFGLCQWTYYSRKQAMYEYIVESQNKSIGDKKAQVDFLLHELTTKYGTLVSNLKKCTTVKAASDLILTQFEKPADQSDTVKNKRASYAMEYYNQYAKISSTAASEVPFIVSVQIANLMILTGPGNNYLPNGKYTGIGKFTIVEVQNGYGLLKSYQTNRNGWIPLSKVTKV